MFVLRQRLIHFSDGTKAKDFTIQSLVVTVSTTIFNYQNPYFISARYFSFMSVAISTAINHLYMTYSFVYRRFHKIEKNDYQIPCFYFLKQPTKAQLQLIYKLSRCYMFRHYRVIFRQLVFITSPSYIRISIAPVGNQFKLISFIQVQLIYKLSRSYMFRHYRVLFRHLVFITSESYICIPISTVDNTI